mgnify:CR=1 FL=1|jgi:chromosome partitioning protein
MGKIITFINEKGGVGKTSVCYHSAWELATQGKRILMIDMDGQTANLTFFAGIEKDEALATVMDVLKNRKTITDVEIEIKENLWLVPADVHAADMGMDIKLTVFRRALEEVKDRFDFIFIDVNPTPGRGHYLALSVSDYAVVVMLPDIASLEGNCGILDSIEEIQETTNDNLQIAGILFNRNSSTKLSKRTHQVAMDMAEGADTAIFNVKIPQAVSLGECVAYHKGITDFDSKSKAAEAIRNFVCELEERIK